VCVCLCVCSQSILKKRILNGSEYDIGWDYDVGDDHYVGNIDASHVHHVSGIRHLDHGPNSPSQALKSALSLFLIFAFQYDSFW